MITRSDIKLILRYVPIIFILYIVWFILQKPFIKEINGWSDIAKGLIYTPILATLGYMLKWNWNTKIGGDNAS